MVKNSVIATRANHLRTYLAPLLVALLLCQPAFVLLAHAQKRNQKPSQKMTEDQRIAHVLSRLTFGARPGDFERVKTMGVDAFISQQLDSDSSDDAALATRLRRLPTLGMSTPAIIDQYTPPKPTPTPAPVKVAENGTATTQAPVLNPNASNAPTEMQMEAKKDESGKMAASQDVAQAPPAAAKPTPLPKNPQMVVTELQRASLLRAVYSERQLYEVMVGFWENHFNVFANKDGDRYYLTSFDRDTIRPFAMGRFRDLLGATAHSPAMLYYLDNWRSSVARPYPATKDKPAGVDGGLNENYARELMELHTLGVDGGYTQKDVQEVARCFSGWTIEKPATEGLFLYRPGLHDNSEKIVLGNKIPAGGGIADAERVLDILARHPATARFVATKLARRFVSDEPPQSVIDRAAAVFLKTDGSIRETLRAIVTSPEFFSPTVYRAKLRSPFEYVAAALRALNAETDADRPIIDGLGRMGQPIFGRITPDGYADRADQWLSSGAMITRFNFASALATNRIKGTKIDLAILLAGTDQANKDAVATQLARLTVSSDLSSATRAALAKTRPAESAASGTAKVGEPAEVKVNATPANMPTGYVAPVANKTAAPTAAVFVTDLLTLLLGSPEFQQR